MGRRLRRWTATFSCSSLRVARALRRRAAAAAAEGAVDAAVLLLRRSASRCPASAALAHMRMAELLKGNTTLKRLDLARNVISDDGAEALANSLRDNTSLEYLNLESNDIAEKGERTASITCRLAHARAFINAKKEMESRTMCSVHLRCRRAHSLSMAGATRHHT